MKGLFGLPTLLQDFIRFLQPQAVSSMRINATESHHLSQSTLWFAHAFLAPRFLRGILIGLLAGFAASFALVATQERAVVSIISGVLLGVIYTATSDLTRRAYADRCMTAAALGVPAWVFFSVILYPLLAGRMPEWANSEMRSRFPELIGWILYGCTLGLLTQALSDIAVARLGAELAPPKEREPDPKRVVILGGGFAGMTTARELEDLIGPDRSVTITLVSETNALLFTPMLAEVAGSSLEPSHISTPIRTSLRRTEVIRGRVQEVDLDRRRIQVATQGVGVRELVFDQLVFALGAVSNYFGLKNVQELALDFKTLIDAIRIRNHVIDMFEQADRETDADVRRERLTFVVAGGGFAGAELAGALNDFSRGILADYPNIRSEDLQVVLVHARERILPELSESLGRYAQESMAMRGVKFRLNCRLNECAPGKVILSDGEMRTRTLIWAAGTAPNPLLRTLSLQTDQRGAAVVDHTMAVPGHPGVWALGDCAALRDAKTGKPCPPTAQFALREARLLARNIRAALQGRAPERFHFNSLGALCVVGHHTACAELTIPFTRGRTMRFRGLFAWLLWRGIYLGKLPGLERKIRVLSDWVVELFFPRDIVQTIELR
jgi:NADH:ubiquinone reductase (H+-translocating)